MGGLEVVDEFGGYGGQIGSKEQESLFIFWLRKA